MSFVSSLFRRSRTNGRSESSKGPLYFLDERYTRIGVYSRQELEDSIIRGAPLTTSELRHSLTYDFNCYLKEECQLGERPSVSATSVRTWLRSDFPRYALSPHKSDYCDYCASLVTEYHKYYKIALNLKNARKCYDADVEHNLALARQASESKKAHLELCVKELAHQKELNKLCFDGYAGISALLRIDPGLDLVGHPSVKDFVYVFDADYQMGKVIPQWGSSPQPGATFYMEKYGIDVFGIVRHTDKAGFVYIAGEEVGNKNADFTTTFLNDFVTRHVPKWVRNIAVRMDNAATNLNQYVIGWAMALVLQQRFSSVRLTYMVPGHGKFAPDRLFSRIAKAYDRHDVFTPQQFIERCVTPFAAGLVFGAQDIISFKEALHFGPVDSITSYRDFLICLSDTGAAVLRVRNNNIDADYVFHSETAETSSNRRRSDCLQHLGLFSYAALKMDSPLPDKKRNTLTKMYDTYVLDDDRPSYIPPRQEAALPDEVSELFLDACPVRIISLIHCLHRSDFDWMIL